MTYEQAVAMHQGDTVLYKGKEHIVSSIQLRGIAAPYFRLNGLDESEALEGKISYKVCTAVPRTRNTQQ
jgi:hypothetical protein